MTEPQKEDSPEWQKLYDNMLEKTSKAIKGVNSADVDWFLRDTNVSILDKPRGTSSTNDTGDALSQSNDTSLNHVLHTSSSPLLPISNAHETNVNKAKPSISSISEEEAHPNAIQEFSIKQSSPKFINRRSSASSTGSISSIESSSSSGGFFSKLKNRLQRSDSVGSASSLALENKTYSPFKKDYSLSNAESQIGSVGRSEDGNLATDENTPPLCDDVDIDDPRLRECIRYFCQEDRRGSCIKGGSSLEQKYEMTKPPSNRHETQNQHFRLPSFLRKMSATTQSVKTVEPVSTTDSSLGSTISTESSDSSRQPLPELKKLKPLKHVAFHSQTFLIDPPQQIPSRNPRKGNVEVLPSGVVRINPLTESDKVAIEKSLRGQGGGLVVGGTGVLGLIEKDKYPSADTEESTPGESTLSNENDVQIDEHAKSLGIEKPMIYSSKKTGYSVPVKKMALDLMYTRCCHLREILPVPAIIKQIPQGSTAPLPLIQLRNPTPTMIEIQTFADFIRIAPIICISLDGVSLSIEQLRILLSAMCAKTQLEKLSLRNTPIDAGGWLLLCWFLSRNKVINKLDVTQCPPLSLNLLKKKKKSIQEEGLISRMVCNHENRSDMDWSLFTAALIARGGIEELILTGCCITDHSVFESLIRKAVSIKTFKLGLAYNQISPQQLNVVLGSWVFSEKCRGLDLGYNDLSSSKYLKTFLNHGNVNDMKAMISKSQVGFLSLNATNLRFNETFKEFFEKFIVQLPNLKYLDMSNNPKLFGKFDKSTLAPSNISHSREDIDRNVVDGGPNSITSGDTMARSKPSGKDNISSNNCASDMTASEVINTYFCSRLPRFRSLARLHLENNGLTSQNLKALFEIVPFCKTLNYLSIVGNDLDIYSATSLLQCLRYSTSLITVDADYSQLPEMFKEKVGLYSMRNMDQFFNNNIKKNEGNGYRSINSKSAPGSLADELNQLLSRKPDEKLDFQSPEVKRVVKRIQCHRLVLQEAFDDLFNLQYKRELNMEGKETLIRLLFVDSALRWALKLVDSSLVDKDERVSSSDIINMNSAEDEKSESKTSMLSKVRDSFSEEHGPLSPVGSDSLPVSRQQSFTNLSNLNKEEGSAMKLSRLGDETLFHSFSSTSGEEIRRRLLNGNISDLDAVIDNISSARDKGIAMKEIFNVCVDMDKQVETQAEESLPLEGMAQRTTLRKNSSPPGMDDKPSPIKGKVESSSNGTTKSLSINETYDKILSEFNK